MKRKVQCVAVAAAAALLTMSVPAGAQAAPVADGLAIPDGPISTKVDPSLSALRTTGARVTVSLRLADPSLAEAVGENAKRVGAKLSRNAQRAHVNALKAKQRGLMDKVSRLGGREIAATQKAVNTVVVNVEASRIDEIAAMPEVVSVKPVLDRELDLSETVPYIGATALHNRTPGLTGAGVRVAVLDSGIDYTHARLGGPGTAEAYEAAYGTSVDDPRTTTTDGLFPTDKVIGGYDFIGEAWVPGLPEVPDPDPIDCGPSAIAAPCAGGHGTHVAAIIAGTNGVAPDAKLYAYKVCSAVSTSCSGVALLQAMDAALDPNGDGDISDAVDVINMSLGSPYGQREDDCPPLRPTRCGWAWSWSPRPATPPTSRTSPAPRRPRRRCSRWRRPTCRSLRLRAARRLAVQHRRRLPEHQHHRLGAHHLGLQRRGGVGTTADDQLGCEPYPAGFFAGKVALIDRGVCAISIKVDNAADAGAIGVLIANNVPGAAPSFSFGGPDTFTPQQTLVIGQEHSNTLKRAWPPAAVTVTVSTADATPLIRSMVATSSRGPSMSYVAIKPEIGAPGASVSAEAGTGTGETAFGGTSGAAPMVSGAAALLLQAHPGRSPLEVKSVLMNTGETDIQINPATRPGRLAEITRIGGGEVRVDRAVDSQTAAWEVNGTSAGLSFGYHAVDRDRTLTKQVEVRNYSNSTRTYTITPSFRYAEDQASGAVRISAPSKVVVGPNRSAKVPVTLTIDADKLPDWVLDGGPNGASGDLLAVNEFDGYLTLSGGGDTVHLPWHVLPHRAADVTVNKNKVKLNKKPVDVKLHNKTRSGQVGTADVFALTGTSPRIPQRDLPGPGDNFAVVDLRAVGVRADDQVLQFGVTTYGQRSHPNYPAEFNVFLDTNRDGVDDWRIWNADLDVVSGTDGRNVVFVQQVGSPNASAFFFTDADLNSANAILTVPLAVVGLTKGAQFDFHVLARDNYFSGAVTDAIENMTFTVGTPKFAASADVVEGARGQACVASHLGGGGRRGGLAVAERPAAALPRCAGGPGGRI